VPTGRRGDPSHMRRVNFLELRKTEVQLRRIPHKRSSKCNPSTRLLDIALYALRIPKGIELPRTPSRRSSQKTYSTHSGE
jgi:hypothetical protein